MENVATRKKGAMEYEDWEKSVPDLDFGLFLSGKGGI